MKIPTGGFVYPISSATLTERSDEDETLLPSEVKTRLQSEVDVRLLSDVEVKKYHLAGLGGTVFTVAFPIPQHAENYKEFVETMKESESNLLEKMRQNKL